MVTHSPLLSPLSVIGMLILVFYSEDSEKIPYPFKILFTLLTVLLVLFFIWLFIQDKRRPRHKITRITVDHKGLHHYRGADIRKTLLFSSLVANPQKDEYDIVLHIPEGDSTPPYDICFFVMNTDLNIIQEQTFYLDCEFVIVNGNLLKRHFVQGIMTFRPDLQIAPNVLDVYGR